MTNTGLLDVAQPRITAAQLAAARGNLIAYRIMAFVTGVVLIAGCIELIFQYGTSLDVGAAGTVWIAHGWLYLIYVIATGALGFKLHWPLPRYALVMLAGTIPTASFVAEHFVTRAARNAVTDQPVPARD